MLNPKHLKQLSFFLENWKNYPEHLENAKKRTIINRLYYYIFLEIREIIKSKIAPVQREHLEKPRTSIHRLVIEIVKNAGFYKEAKYLREIRGIRTSFDYELNSIGEDISLERAKETVKLLESFLPILQKCPDSEVQKAFSKAIENLSKKA
ncbi:MAG: hypothetical protein DSY34_04720 [Desulfurobacterium sp.]|nr:MAG: hypothetical protein DSY34_04720 [Desulfurobacterium sp.]